MKFRKVLGVFLVGGLFFGLVLVWGLFVFLVVLILLCKEVWDYDVDEKSWSLEVFVWVGVYVKVFICYLRFVCIILD